MILAAKTERVPWGLVILLLFAMGISFFDRGNLAAAGFLLWSLETLSTAVVSMFSALLCMRLLLGVGEAVAYPASSRIVAAVVPEHRRGLTNSVIDLGARLGPALGILLGAQFVGRLGWRGLLRRWDVWGTCGGLGCASCAWYFLLSWLPSYLVRESQFSMNSLSVGGALPGLFLSCLSLGVYASNLWPLTQTLAGPMAAAPWTGFQNAFGNLAGIVSPIFTGWIVSHTGRFAFAFLAASLACVAGAACFGLLVRDSDAGSE